MTPNTAESHSTPTNVSRPARGHITASPTWNETRVELDVADWIAMGFAVGDRVMVHARPASGHRAAMAPGEVIAPRVVLVSQPFGNVGRVVFVRRSA